jgi:CheY-like chemotaxis protein
MHDQSIFLLVEDNPDDVFLMKRAMKAARMSNPLHIATHGQQAIDYLSGNGIYADRTQHPLPDFIFLDLKLPYKSGFEVLQWIRGKTELKDITVVVLTSSSEDRDIQQAHRLHTRAYLVKPPTAKMLLDLRDSPSPVGS